jgi:formylglycine-generating enzyme required for sulfatase activity
MSIPVSSFASNSQRLTIAVGLAIALAGCGETPQAETPAVPTTTPPAAANSVSMDAAAAPAEKPVAVHTPAAPAEAPAGMAWIPGGTFRMGSDEGMRDEAPAHDVALDGFWIDKTEVTNAQFQKFVDATGFQTVAERKPKREDFIGQVPDISTIPEENLVAGSLCLNENFDRRALKRDHPLWPYQVWHYVKGANWKHPEGPESSIADRMHHPVTQVSWDDCVAYCKWAGKSLPTEAEWEYAARGGTPGQAYPWGSELRPGGQWMANIWQGKFPDANEVLDGYKTTAPVGSFAPNGYGLFDMSGNVWEWCSDYFRDDYYAKSPNRNPFGPPDSRDPNEPGLVKRVQRGGSFLCSDNYCIGYRVAARMKGTPDSGTYHCGFRCVVRASELDAYRKAATGKSSGSVK